MDIEGGLSPRDEEAFIEIAIFIERELIRAGHVVGSDDGSGSSVAGGLRSLHYAKLTAYESPTLLGRRCGNIIIEAIRKLYGADRLVKEVLGQ